MRSLLLTPLLVAAAALTFAPGAWAQTVVDGESATTTEISTSDPAPATSLDGSAETAPSTETAPSETTDDTTTAPTDDTTTAPAESGEPVVEPADGIPTPPTSDTAPPLPTEEVPTDPVPADEVPVVTQPPPPVEGTTPVDPPPAEPPTAPDPKPVRSPAAGLSALSGAYLAAADPVALSFDSLRAARDQALARSQVVRDRRHTAGGHQLRLPFLGGLLRSGSPSRQVGGSASGAGMGGGASFSPDGSGARTLAGLVLLAVMGAGLIVSTRATIPSSFAVLVRLERPG